MALADSARAIGGVTRLLQDHLLRRGFAVTVGKPEVAATTNAEAKLNLFLYETSFDGSLKNVSLQDGQPPPLWLTLKYLLTAFDDQENSDSAAAHELLGRGVAALHELNFLRLDALVAPAVRLALENNPEPLKITFDESNAELLSKIMQGTDERYRLSVAFQMRPVMIAPAETYAYSLLVGVNYTAAPPDIVGLEGRRIEVLATLGPRLFSLVPEQFETGETFELFGEDLHISGLECVLGRTVLVIESRRPERLLVCVEGPLTGGAVEGPIASGAAISAGEHPLIVRRELAPNRFRSSNLLTARLLPTITGANLDVTTGTLTITGTLLGTENDDVIVALYREGTIVRTFANAAPDPDPAAPPGKNAVNVVTTADQKTLTIANIKASFPLTVPPLPADSYQVILRVNGQQAKISPTITVT